MKKVFLSDSGPFISDSIYSFMRCNESDDLKVKNMEEITNYCLELGINAFDLSNTYGLGQMEELALKYNSNVEQLAVAWIHKLGALPIIGSLSKDRIKNAATASEIQLSHEDWHRIYTIARK